MLILSTLLLLNDDVYVHLEITIVIHLSCLFVTYSLIALRNAMKSDTLTNENSNAFHEEDSGDKIDTGSDSVSPDFCKSLQE